MPLIQLKDVHKEYYLGEATVPALKGVRLTVQRGEFIAVWGPSGSGKSTLCNLMGTLDSPTSGTVLLDSQDVSLLTDEARSILRNRAVGFVFQSFNLVPVLSAVENVMLPLEIRGQSRRSAMQQAVRRLEEVEMRRFMAHRPHKLSGGQQQRVAIARALITDPYLVLADEPTGNLDSETAMKIISLMRAINEQHGTTFVFSTHDQRLLDQVNRRIHLRDGIIVEDTVHRRTGKQRLQPSKP